ncbi:hypothetical protein ACFYNL_21965 [Streptomyces sp. NPDC007808]|uniref:hypothetical protein n=1 Tax=Streptomyces sp. NPDC007808 TaxID=3364779 RepID=UPI0036C38BC8
MSAFLSVVAVIAFTATAGLPWWVVAAVTLLIAGFAAGRGWSPGRCAKHTSASGPAAQPVWFSADKGSTVRTVPVHVRVPRQEEHAEKVRSGR